MRASFQLYSAGLVPRFFGFPDVCPAFWDAPGSVRDLSRDLSRVLLFSRTYVRCPVYAPVRCFCFFVYPGFCLCNCAVASATRLAGAVIETGDGLYGALLLSLRHLSTSFRTTQAWFRGPLRRDITADRDGFSNIVRASLVSWYRKRFRILCMAYIFRFFICADGKKTLFVGIVPLVLD